MNNNQADISNQGEAERPACPEEKVMDKGQQASQVKGQKWDKKKLPPAERDAEAIKTALQEKPTGEDQKNNTGISENISAVQIDRSPDQEKPAESEKIETTIKEVAEVKSSTSEASDNEINKINDKIIHAESAEKSHKGNFYIQVGAWRKIEYARDTFIKLKDRYPDIYIIKEHNFNMVRIDGIMTKHEGNLMMMELEDDYNLLPFLANNR